MANFIVCCDDNEERAATFLAAIQPRIAPLDGLQVSSIAEKNVIVVWAACETCPVHVVRDGPGLAIIWGDMFDGERRVAPKDLFQKWGNRRQGSFPAFDGYHVAVVVDGQGGVRAGADVLGLFPVYYYVNKEILLIGSSPELFFLHPQFQAAFNPSALVGILLTNGLVGKETLLKEVKRLSAGHLLAWSRGKAPEEILNYSFPSSTEHFDTPYENQIQLMHNALSAVFSRYMNEKDISLMLSGGLDSRLVAGYLQKFPTEKTAITMGARTDIEMRCAVQVANHLKLKQRTFSLEQHRFCQYAEIQSTWEYCANGFSNIYTWGMPLQMRDISDRIVAGFLMDVVIGGPYPKAMPKDFAFETIFNQDNRWGIAPEILARLLRKSVFADGYIETTIQELKMEFAQAAMFDSKRTLCYKLRHRQRYHIGGWVWHLSFASWPVLPVLDRGVIELVGGLPDATLVQRRAQKDLLLTYFSDLAAIPLDNNTKKPVILRPRLRYVLKNYYQRRLDSFGRFVNRHFSGEGIERRHYYRLHDFNGPEWVEVRKLAEAYRDCAADYFEMDIFNKLLPPPDAHIHFRDGIMDAAGLQNLLGFLLWAGKRAGSTVGGDIKNETLPKL